MRYYKSAFLTVVKPVKTYQISADYAYTLLMPTPSQSPHEHSHRNDK